MFTPEELHFEPHPLSKDRGLFERFFPHVHPLAFDAFKLWKGYRDLIPCSPIPNDPDFPQNWKARSGFMSSVGLVLHSLIEDGVVSDPEAAAKIGIFADNLDLNVSKKTKVEDIAEVNNMLSLVLKFALTPVSRN